MVHPTLSRIAWTVDLDGEPHTIELGQPTALYAAPMTFAVDGLEHRFPRRLVLRSTATEAFAVGGHPSTLIRRFVRPPFMTRLRMVVGAERRWLPATLLAHLIGGAALGGGVSTAAGVTAQRSWLIYELTIGDVPRGSWVAHVKGGAISSWRLVPPGGVLPKRGDTAWSDLGALR